MKKIRRVLPSSVLAIAAAVLFLAPRSARAGGLRAGINVPCLEKAVKGDNPPATAWVALGYLDQVRGDLKEAVGKYEKAFSAGSKDLANEPIDFTLVGDIIWIQNDLCRVPVPKQGADATAATDAKGPETTAKYPPALNSIAAEGDAVATAVIGPNGHPIRVRVADVSAGPAQVPHTYGKPGQEAAERLMARVQFALVTLQTLKDYKFADGSAGKVFTWKPRYVPPHDLLSDHELPGSVDSSAAAVNPVLGGAQKPR